MLKSPTSCRGINPVWMGLYSLGAQQVNLCRAVWSHFTHRLKSYISHLLHTGFLIPHYISISPTLLYWRFVVSLFYRKWSAFRRSSGPTWPLSPVSSLLSPERGKSSRSRCKPCSPTSQSASADWTGSWAVSWTADLLCYTAGRWLCR